MSRKIRTLLIANRGEIACRIMRTAKARGVKTVAVYSDIDRDALHVRTADEAFAIGGASPAESYLNIAALLAAAKAAGADAVHPGYGFLSERADFAAACVAAGLIFVGPPAVAIAAMGDKAEAKRRMIAAGVPCVPGYQGDEQADERLIEEAHRIGFPLLVKASAGGGGRGQRIVGSATALGEDIAAARREAERAFGDGRLILERALTGVRHVEVQVLADQFGNIVHLGDRDCSLQRRRQKIIEEAPAPGLSPATRRRMGEAACAATRAVGYQSAGTVEFLYDPATEDFYFLEMNTRLQVEHPVTECVTGLDLVALMLDIAEGAPLPLDQTDVRCEGVAIEARLYAEDPREGFLPQTGRMTAFAARQMPGLRIDAGIAAGDSVSAYYDPVIAKVIAHAPSRDAAAAELAAGLENLSLMGIVTNASFLVALLRDETFLKGEADTLYVERALDRLNAHAATPVTIEDLTLAAALLADAPMGRFLSGWASRAPAPVPLKLQERDAIYNVLAIYERSGVVVDYDSAEARLEIISLEAGTLRYRINGRIAAVRYVREGEVVDVQRGAQARRFIDVTRAPAAEGAAAGDAIKAPMAGVVTALQVKPGDAVRKGEFIAAIEAMKMEHKLLAPRDGVVDDVKTQVGAQAAIRATLVTLRKD